VNKPKNVLIIAHYFPPYGGVGVNRVAKFVKYLPDLGWDLTVLTTKVSNEYLVRDYDLWSEIKDKADVVQTSAPLYRFINDNSVKWMPSLIRESIAICKKKKIDILFISGGPFLPFLSGYLCKKLLNIPYVLDYRDGWNILPNHMPTSLKGKFLMRMECFLEKIIIVNADAVINASPFIMNAYRANFKSKLDGKMHLIPNGHDNKFSSDNFFDRKGKELCIVYTGKLYCVSLVQELIKSLKTYDNERLKLIRIVFIGENDKKLITGLFNNIVKVDCYDYMPYRECMDFIRSKADILLTMDKDDNGIPAKFYDYLSFNKPIVVIEPKEGPIERFFSTPLEGVYFADYRRYSCIAKKIELAQTYNYDMTSRKIISTKYSRKKASRQLSEVLLGVIN
jgi:glycosyltransferase involved in cell wall biosynthesis